MEQEIKKQPYEKPILTPEGKLRDAAQILITKDIG
jgi:hypothetical protein